MKYERPMQRRRSVRLKAYDYQQPGAYFVTVCVWRRQCLLGTIERGAARTGVLGRTVRAVWEELPAHYPQVVLDEFVVMPNHVHGILFLCDVGAGLKPAPTQQWCASVGAGFKPASTEIRHGLTEIVRAFKTYSARRANKLRGIRGEPLWQRGYYDHVVRSENELARIREYIRNNPLQWDLDRENPVTHNCDVGAGLKPAPADDVATIFGGVRP